METAPPTIREPTAGVTATRVPRFPNSMHDAIRRGQLLYDADGDDATVAFENANGSAGTLYYQNGFLLVPDFPTPSAGMTACFPFCVQASTGKPIVNCSESAPRTAFFT